MNTPPDEPPAPPPEPPGPPLAVSFAPYPPPSDSIPAGVDGGPKYEFPPFDPLLPPGMVLPAFPPPPTVTV